MEANMGKVQTKNDLKVSQAARIYAPAERVYQVLSDYEVEHNNILPPEHFVDMKVEQGGKGAGTIISFKVRIMGSIVSYRMQVSEPIPGRELVEADLLSDTVTTFSLKPLGEGETRLEISTRLKTRKGLAGKIEKLTIPSVMKKLYRKELKRLATYLNVKFELE